jgi:cysteine-rich repeat protein
MVPRLALAALLLVAVPVSAGAEGGIVLKSLGGRAALYGNFTLWPADDMGHAIAGGRAQLLGCPQPEFSGSERVYTTCRIDRAQLERSLGTSPEGQRLVVIATPTNGRTNCAVEFSTWGGPCTGKGFVQLQGSSVQWYECAFVVPDLSTTDFEVTASWVEQEPNSFDHPSCFLVGIDPPSTPNNPVCGNHRLESSEQCDDGNTTPGDGCDATCHRETGAPPGPDVALEIFMDAWVVSIANGINPVLETLLAQKFGTGPNNTVILGPAVPDPLTGVLKAAIRPSVSTPRMAAGRGKGGAKVLAKGKRKFKDGDPQFVEFTMKITRAGRRLLKKGEPFGATIEVEFRGSERSSTRSQAISIPNG